MEARERSIQEVFCDGRVLRVPFFQRHYKWGEDQWNRFDADMMGLIERGDNYKYFLGSLILKEDQITEQERQDDVTSKYTVIDGQQRLTTLTIYLKALVNQIEDKSKKRRFNNLFLYNIDVAPTPKLIHSMNDRGAYRDIILDGRTAFSNYISDKIIRAYEYFQKQFRDRNNQNLIDVLQAIYSKITFVVVSLNQNDDEQRIFDTINSLGLKLTIDELMKNFLYQRENEDEYRRNWMPIFDTFDDNDRRTFWDDNDAATSQSARDNNTVIYNFFFDFVRIKMWDYALSPRHRSQFVKKDCVLDACKAFVEDYGADKQELANEIIEYAKLYKKYFDKNKLNAPIPRMASIERIATIAMAYSNPMRAYLLYILRNVDDEAQRNDIFAFLETYMVRRAICGSDNSTSEIWAQQLICKRINSLDQLRTHIMNWGIDISTHMPSSYEVLDALKSKDSKKYAQLILYLYESKINDSIDVGYNYFTVRQIIPTPKVNNRAIYPPYADVEKEKQRKNIIKTLGNYLLLKLGDNNFTAEDLKEELRVVKKFDNKAFNEKKRSLQLYFKQVRCMNQWFPEETQWNENSINNRNESLARIVEKIWNINEA